MFILGNFVAAVAELVKAVLSIYSFILLIRVLLSWVNPDPFNPIVQFLTRLTDPVLEPLRRVIPPIGMIDISPIVAFLLLQAVQIFLVRTLLDLSMRLRQ